MPKATGHSPIALCGPSNLEVTVQQGWRRTRYGRTRRVQGRPLKGRQTKCQSPAVGRQLTLKMMSQIQYCGGYDSRSTCTTSVCICEDE